MTTIKEIMAEIKVNSLLLKKSGDTNAHNTARSMVNNKYGSDWRTKYKPVGSIMVLGCKAGGTKY